MQEIMIMIDTKSLPSSHVSPVSQHQLGAEIDRLRAELDEETATRERMRDILVRTANELKGHPEGTVEHDWSDLQSCVFKLKEKLFDVRQTLADTQASEAMYIARCRRAECMFAERSDELRAAIARVETAEQRIAATREECAKIADAHPDTLVSIGAPGSGQFKAGS